MVDDHKHDSTILQFYSRSADEYPGKGSGEFIEDSMVDSYMQLAQISDWRKKLSNFYIKEFTLDGHRWASVEHYYQGNKFKKENPDYYLKFTLDSDSDFCRDAALAKKMGSRKKAIADTGFYTSGLPDKLFYNGQYAKFSQNKKLKNMLIHTNNAKLIHYRRGQPSIHFRSLELIRNELKT